MYAINLIFLKKIVEQIRISDFKMAKNFGFFPLPSITAENNKNKTQERDG